jgi:hypothetical protein
MGGEASGAAGWLTRTMVKGERHRPHLGKARLDSRTFYELKNMFRRCFTANPIKPFYGGTHYLFQSPTMAQQPQAPQDGTNTASTKEAVFMSLFVISFVLYCLRIWSHTRPVYKLDTSDHVISLAMVMVSISERVQSTC